MNVVSNIVQDITSHVRGVHLTHMNEHEIALYVPSEDAMVILPVDDEHNIDISEARYMDGLCDGYLNMVDGMWKCSGNPVNNLVKYLLGLSMVSNPGNAVTVV